MKIIGVFFKRALFSFGVLTSVFSVSAQSTSNVKEINHLNKCAFSKSPEKTEKKENTVPISNSIEFLKLLRNIHENFLLIDSQFMSKKTLAGFFGNERVTQKWPYGKEDKAVWMDIKIEESNQLAGVISLSQRADEISLGSLLFRTENSSSDLNAELIEKYLVPGIAGIDPNSEISTSRTSEMLSAIATRPRPSSAKGFYEYVENRKTQNCISKLVVRLSQNGTVFDINLTQEVK